MSVTYEDVEKIIQDRPWFWRDYHRESVKLLMASYYWLSLENEGFRKKVEELEAGFAELSAAQDILARTILVKDETVENLLKKEKGLLLLRENLGGRLQQIKEIVTDLP